MYMIVAKLKINQFPKECEFCRYYSMEEDFLIPNKTHQFCTINYDVVENEKIRPDWCPLIEIK